MMCRWYSNLIPNFSLDVFLSNVLQQEIHTVSLRPSESSLLWSHKRDQVVEPVNQTIQFEQEQLHIEVPTVHTVNCKRFRTS